MRDDAHLSEQELLLAADGELSRARSARAKNHLNACWSCRARLKEIEEAVANFVEVFEEEGNEQRGGSAAGEHAQFRARLEQLAATKPNAWSMHWRPKLAFAAVAMFIAVAGGWAYRSRMGTGPAPRDFAALGSPVPNQRLTPGALRHVTKAEVCADSEAGREHALPISTQWKVFQEYGLPNAQPDNYEVDHLITPALGGSDDLRNLWPEPHSDTVWNSYVKDQLEERLHRMVCSGSVDLTTAQNDIAKDWIAAYKKYLKSDSPLRSDSSHTAGSAQEPNS